MLRIAFGGDALLSSLTGIGQYAWHLGRGLREQPGIEVDFFYRSGFSRELKGDAGPMNTTFRMLVRRFVPNAYGIHRALQRRRFAAAVRRKQYDLYHEPAYLALPFEGPTVITVHDLSWIRYPQTHPTERVRAMHRYFEPALRRAALLLTDSDFVRKEIVDVFGVDPSMIVPIPLGLDPVFRPLGATETEPVLQRLDLIHGEFFLSVGTLEPRKNLQATVAAYATLPEAVRNRRPLVLAGMKGWRTAAIERLLAPLVNRGQVRVLGYLDRGELAVLTAGALTLVYPSLYEGFGLPPLEAMGCGIPTITSNVSSLPELVGDAGIQVDPLDTDALAQAMLLLASDEAVRQSLSRRAQDRAAAFTWDRCVADTVGAYRRAIAASSR